MSQHRISILSPGHILPIVTAAVICAAAAVSPVVAAIPDLTVAEATAKIASYRNPLEGKTIASFPAAVSSSEEALNSMGALAVGKSCFAAWEKTLRALVEAGYLTGFRRSEAELAIEERHLTPKGRNYFGSVLPVRYHSRVRIVPALEEARLDVTSIGPGAEGLIAEFECTPCAAFQILWEYGVLSPECHGRVHESVVVKNGKVRGHAHFEPNNGGWTVVKVELGSHTERE